MSSLNLGSNAGTEGRASNHQPINPSIHDNAPTNPFSMGADDDTERLAREQYTLASSQLRGDINKDVGDDPNAEWTLEDDPDFFEEIDVRASNEGAAGSSSTHAIGSNRMSTGGGSLSGGAFTVFFDFSHALEQN